MSHLCGNCGEPCTPVTDTKLSEWEIAEVKSRAADILASSPASRWHHRIYGEGRQERLGQLASEYGINLRTLYRYLRRAA
jgi:hypothetical protein